MTPAKQLRSRSFLWLMAVVVLMTACGDGDGNSDTVLTGFSGVLIFGIIAWAVYRVVKKRTK